MQADKENSPHSVPDKFERVRLIAFCVGLAMLAPLATDPGLPGFIVIALFPVLMLVVATPALRGGVGVLFGAIAWCVGLGFFSGHFLTPLGYGGEVMTALLVAAPATYLLRPGLAVVFVMAAGLSLPSFYGTAGVAIGAALMVVLAVREEGIWYPKKPSLRFPRILSGVALLIYTICARLTFELRGMAVANEWELSCPPEDWSCELPSLYMTTSGESMIDAAGYLMTFSTAVCIIVVAAATKLMGAWISTHHGRKAEAELL